MKTRFSLLMTALLICRMALCQVHISISDPQTWSAEELQPYVGQTVIFDEPMVVCSNYNGYTIAPRRLYTPTNQALPRSNDYYTMVSRNKSAALNLVGMNDYHRCGEKIYNLKAIVNSNYSLTWLDGGVWQGNTRADLEAGIPDVGDYSLLVCAYNLENYFLNSGNHDRQRKKIIDAFTRINADLIGVVEMEEGNNGIKEIAEYLNTTLPDRQYKYCDNGSTSSYQTVAYIYDSKTVKPLGSTQKINVGTKNRKKMQCFEEIATGERFIFSINHFKAKSGSGTGGNADMSDGQGSFNADRKEEAQAVVDNYKTWSRQIGEPDILIMGDLNAYAKEDPITVFANNGMIDLHRAFHADSSYSYSYGDKLYGYLTTAGYLDHAICNTTMRPQITGMAAYHINSDESDIYTYDKSGDTTMFRGSDHDPVLVGLKLDGTLVYDPSPKINSADILAGNATELVIYDAQKDGQKSFYAIYTTSGVLVSRAEILSELNEVQLPVSPGMYIVYIYFNGEAYRRSLIVR